MCCISISYDITYGYLFQSIHAQQSLHESLKRLLPFSGELSQPLRPGMPQDYFECRLSRWAYHRSVEPDPENTHGQSSQPRQLPV